MKTEPVNFGYRSWRNAGPKFAVVMKRLRLELAWKLSTILMELHVNNFRLVKSMRTSKKKCFGKCLLKLIFIDIQLLVPLILLKDVILKLLKSSVYVISIHILCLRPNLFNFKKAVKILDICCNFETLGELENGKDHGVITVPLGKLIVMPISNLDRDKETTVLILLMKLKLNPKMEVSGLLSRISLDFSIK